MPAQQRSRSQVFEVGEGVARWSAVMLTPRPPLDAVVDCLWYVEGSPKKRRAPAEQSSQVTAADSV